MAPPNPTQGIFGNIMSGVSSAAGKTQKVNKGNKNSEVKEDKETTEIIIKLNKSRIEALKKRQTELKAIFDLNGKLNEQEHKEFMDRTKEINELTKSLKGQEEEEKNVNQRLGEHIALTIKAVAENKRVNEVIGRTTNTIKLMSKNFMDVSGSLSTNKGSVVDSFGEVISKSYDLQGAIYEVSKSGVMFGHSITESTAVVSSLMDKVAVSTQKNGKVTAKDFQSMGESALFLSTALNIDTSTAVDYLKTSLVDMHKSTEDATNELVSFKLMADKTGATLGKTIFTGSSFANMMVDLAKNSNFADMNMKHLAATASVVAEMMTKAGMSVGAARDAASSFMNFVAKPPAEISRTVGMKMVSEYQKMTKESFEADLDKQFAHIKDTAARDSAKATARMVMQRNMAGKTNDATAGLELQEAMQGTTKSNEAVVDQMMEFYVKGGGTSAAEVLVANHAFKKVTEAEAFLDQLEKQGGAGAVKKGIADKLSETDKNQPKGEEDLKRQAIATGVAGNINNLPGAIVDAITSNPMLAAAITAVGYTSKGIWLLVTKAYAGKEIIEKGVETATLVKGIFGGKAGDTFVKSLEKGLTHESGAIRNVSSKLLKTGSVLSSTSKILGKAAGLAGPLIDVGFAIHDYNKAITPEEKKKSLGSGAGRVAGGMVGMGIGAAAGLGVLSIPTAIIGFVTGYLGSVIGESIAENWDGIAKGFDTWIGKPFTEWVINPVKKLGSAIKVIGNMVGDALKTAYKSTIGPYLDPVLTKAGDVLSAIGGFFGTIGSVIVDGFTGAFSWLKEGWDYTSNIFTDIVNTLKDIWDWISHPVEKFVDEHTGKGSWIGDASSAVSSGWNSLSSGVSSIGSSVSSVGGSIAEDFSDRMEKEGYPTGSAVGDARAASAGAAAARSLAAQTGSSGSSSTVETYTNGDTAGRGLKKTETITVVKNLNPMPAA